MVEIYAPFSHHGSLPVAEILTGIDGPLRQLIPLRNDLLLALLSPLLLELLIKRVLPLRQTAALGQAVLNPVGGHHLAFFIAAPEGFANCRAINIPSE